MATKEQIERLEKAKADAERVAQGVPFPIRGMLRPVLEFMAVLVEIVKGEGGKNGD